MPKYWWLLGERVVRAFDVETLKQLALLGAMEGPVELASNELAALLDVSQQTASRRLIELSENGLLQRDMGLRKQRIRISQEGRAILEAEHLVYQRLFDQRDRIQIRGDVRTGLGEGRYYLSRPGYHEQFIQHLGWEPYPGTLNLELTGPETNKIRFLKRNPVHIIEGFQAEGRSFGGVTCHPARLNGHECAAILPNRSHYTSTLELIAPFSMREKLPCKDGDTLEVTVFLTPHLDTSEIADNATEA